MNWLGQWLKEITMIILLATFIDLILPNRSMQRYVKLVLSLIILLTLLSPVLKLFDTKIADQLASEWEEALSTSKAARNKDTSVVDMKRQGEWLAKAYKTSALQLTEEKVGKQMKEQLTVALRHDDQAMQGLSKQLAQVQVERLQVKLACNAKGDPVIQHIELDLAAKGVSATAPDSEGKIAVEPIKPVQIEANAPDQGRFRSSFTGLHDSATVSKKMEARRAETEVQHFRKKAAARAIQSLMSVWIVSKDQISVDWLEMDHKE